MALKAMYDNGIDITSVADGNHYYYSAGRSDGVLNGVLNNMKVTNSGVNVTLQTGQLSIQGRHVTNDAPITLELQNNQVGYLVIRYDITESAGREAKFLAITVAELKSEDLINGGKIRDFILYDFSVSGGFVTLTDKRGYLSSDGFFPVTVAFSSGTWTATTRTSVWTTSIDLTGVIYKGSKIWYLSGATRINAIVHDITTTKITLFHQAGQTATPTPTIGVINVGKTMYPIDFPEDDDVNWTISYDLTNSFSQANPVAGTFYATTLSLTLGVGKYKVKTSAVGSLSGSFVNNNNQQYFGTVTGIGTTPSSRSKKVSGGLLATTVFSSTNYNIYSFEEVVQVPVGTTTHKCVVMAGVAGGTALTLTGGMCYMLATSIYA